MPSITNIHNLPDALVAAVRNDPYQGGGDISVTKLIDSPQRRGLWRRHEEDIEEDVSNRIWSLMGQAVHHILERADTDALVEERLYANCDGTVLSGQFDRLHFDTKTLSDYKVTTAFKSDGNESWTRQLNVLRWLAYKNGYDVEHLEIVAIFRDWRKTEAARNPEYPQAPVKVIPVEVWSLRDTEEYITLRLALHAKAMKNPEMVPCSDEERWYSGDKWAISKPGAKRALRVLESEPVAADVPDGYVAVKRPGEYRRCESYCEVALWCDQYRAHRASLADAAREANIVSKPKEAGDE